MLEIKNLKGFYSFKEGDDEVTNTCEICLSNLNEKSEYGPVLKLNVNHNEKKIGLYLIHTKCFVSYLKSLYEYENKKWFENFVLPNRSRCDILEEWKSLINQNTDFDILKANESLQDLNLSTLKERLDPILLKDYSNKAFKKRETSSSPSAPPQPIDSTTELRRKWADCLEDIFSFSNKYVLRMNPSSLEHIKPLIIRLTLFFDTVSFAWTGCSKDPFEEKLKSYLTSPSIEKLNLIFKELNKDERALVKDELKLTNEENNLNNQIMLKIRMRKACFKHSHARLNEFKQKFVGLRLLLRKTKMTEEICDVINDKMLKYCNVISFFYSMRGEKKPYFFPKCKHRPNRCLVMITTIGHHIYLLG